MVPALAFSVAFSVFVVIYEEPHLATLFGVSYEAYRRAVPRWINKPPKASRTN
jgi:protein-S-isoprenylcysteine O-methyltransferase Ste14